MSKIVNQLIASIGQHLPVERMLCGPKASFATSQNSGVACNLTHGMTDKETASAIDFVSEFTGKPAGYAARRLWEHHHPVCKASAVALLNSTLPALESANCNGYELISKLAPQKRVAMVGHFKMADKLRKLAGHLDILEKEPQEGDLDAERASEIIPQADIVIVTGTTFVNGTIDEILSFTKSAQTVMLLGPTTPVTKTLFEFGVSIICGVSIERNAANIEKLILSGASFRDISSWRYATVCRDKKLLQRLGLFW